MINACPFIASVHDVTVSASSEALCSAFSARALMTGLRPFVLEFLNRVNIMSDRRMRARLFSDPALRGQGIVYPVATYNYSVDEAETFVAANTENIGQLQAPAPLPLTSYDGDLPAAGAFLNAPNGTLNYSQQAELAGPEMQWILQATSMFLTPGLVHFTTLYFDAANSTIASFVAFLGVFSAVFYTAFILYIGLVFLPQVKATHRDILYK